MSSECSLAVEDRFGPIVDGCHENFDFTLLFEESILFIGPLCLVWLLAVYRILQLWPQRTIMSPGILLPLKLAAWTPVLLSQIMFLILVTSGDGPQTRTTLAAGSIGIPAFVTLACLSYFEHVRAVRTSTLLNLFLLFTIPMDALRTRTLLRMPYSNATAISVGVMAGTKFCALLGEVWWKCSLSPNLESCSEPEESQGIIERALMFRMAPVFRTGYVKTLQMKHLYKIAGRLSFGSFRALFESGDSNVRIPLTRSRQFLLLHLKDILDPVFPRLCLLALSFAQPFLVQRAIQRMSKPKSAALLSQEGGGLVAAYILVYFGIAVTSSIYEQKASRASTAVRADVALMVYQQSLRIDHTAMSSKDSSTTMITADVEKVQLGLRRFHDVWGGLASVAIGLWLVEVQLGYSSLVTLGLIVACLAVSGYFSTIAGKSQQAWMEGIERRLDKTVQTLKGIRSVKQLGASKEISRVLNAERAAEIKLSKRFRVALTGLITASFVSLTMLPAVGFGLHVATHRKGSGLLLDAESAFAAMTLFQIISSQLAEAAGHTMNALVANGSLQRIDEFLSSSQWRDTRNSLGRESGGSGFSFLKHPLLREEEMDEPAVTLDFVSARWTSEGKPVIKEAIVNVPSHGLTVVAGPSGCGKSTLLRVILGDLAASEGSVSVKTRRMGYCDQKPWIANVSIRDNVVGAFSFDHAHYRFALEKCALDRDLQDLADGDKHICGLNGASLSGGQRVRVALARAIYSRAEIVLLDDCLVGLDTDTERQILNNMFGANGVLTSPPMTCILATSSAKYLSLAEHIISIDDQGYVSEEYSSSDDLLAITHPDDVAVPDRPNNDKKGDSKDEPDSEKAIKPVDDVASHTPSSDFQVYAWYFNHVGKADFIAFLFFSSLFVLGSIYPQVWLSDWTKKSPEVQRASLTTFWGIYFGVGSMAWVGFMLSCLWLCLRIAVRGARVFHELLVQTTLNAPLQFFTTTDTGITLNRFAQDLQIIDMELPLALVGTVMNMFMLTAQCVVIIVQSNYSGFAVLAIAIVIGLLYHVYLRSSRRLRLMEIEAKSPVLSLLMESVEGLATIRSMGWMPWYLQKGLEALGRSQLPYHLLQSAQVSLLLSLDLFVATLALIVISIAIRMHTTNGSSLGLALLNIVGLGLSVKGVVHFWTLLEITLGAVARIRDYAMQTPSENNGEAPPSPSWPSDGRILFKDIAISYSSALPPVISDLTLDIAPNEKVAICGRTGSGKSTLINSLLQLVDFTSGTISIDDVDIATLAKEEMRSRFVTLPQETIALSVTAREYARIHGITSEDDIVRGLREIVLWDTVERNGGLDMIMNDDNLSHSQRRLFSVALACLRKGKIVLMDEPTGHLDEETQAYLRRAVTEVFASSTVVCVTHHLEAVLDFDTVVVMESGVIAERGNPKQLLEQPDSRFAMLYGSQLKTAAKGESEMSSVITSDYGDDA